MRAMLFHNEKTVNTAFLDFPVMRIDRIYDFVPKSSARTAFKWKTFSFRDG